MKYFIYGLGLLISLNIYAKPIDDILKGLSRVYEDTPDVFNGARVGVEQGITSCIISQENMVADLEQNLEFDPGYCEYKTTTDFKENITLIENDLNPRAARIIRKLRNEGYIAHISARTISFQHKDEDCVKKMYRLALTNGSLIWIDFI